MVVLQEISSAIVNERNGTALLRHILDVLYRRMKMLRGTFTIRRGNDLMIEASHGLDEQEMKRGHYHVGEGITGHVAETGRPHVIEDISRDSRFLNRTRTRKSGEKVAFICVPIIHLQQVIGTLSIDRPVDRETDLERDQKLLEIVGNIVGDALAASLQAHEERAALMAENEKLRQLLTTNPGELIGNCRPMLQVYEQIRQVAPSDATVLIRGSSGTGKELVARAVVNLSGRKDKPLVTLNCAAMPENLLESELFGYEEGAFTGARKGGRPGLFEFAHKGTLFLDEVEGMSQAMQVKLLRVLQEREIMRVGGNQIINVDVRIVAATNESLEEKVEDGSFRRDLYYRLNALPALIPPLRERGNDILLLIETFRQRSNGRFILSDEVRDLLLHYSWPGNIRELQNVVEYLSFTGQDEIGVEDLPPTFIKIKDTDTRHGAGGLVKGRLTENGNKWNMNAAGAGNPASGIPAGGIPAGNTMDDQYPNGEYLNGQYPDGQYPNGQYPDGFWFVLEQLYLASEQDELIGRERILKTAKSNYIPLSQKEIRDILNYMACNGIAKVSRGRGGSRITLIGRNKWEEYKRMTN